MNFHIKFLETTDWNGSEIALLGKLMTGGFDEEYPKNLTVLERFSSQNKFFSKFLYRMFNILKIPF